MPRYLPIVLCLLFIPSSALPIPDFHDYSQYTHWNGSFHNSGDEITSAVTCQIMGTSYLASTGLVSGLTFYGINAGSLQELGNLPLAGVAQDVVFDGEIGYVVSQPNRMNKVAAFSPASPISQWLDILPGSPVDATLFGQYILIACGADGLLVYDRTESFNIPVGVVATWSGVAYEVRTEGTTALVRTQTGITAVDLTDPLNPVEKGSIAVSGSLCLAVQDGRAYVGQMTTPETGGRVTELDVTNPNNLTVIGTFSGFGSPSVMAMQVRDGMLVTAGHHDLKFIDLGLGEVVWDGVGSNFPRAIAFLDDHLALACGFDGFNTYRVKTSGYPPATDFFGISETLKHLQIDGDFLLGHYDGTVYCFDLEPSLPELAWTYTDPDPSQYVLSLLVQNGRIYIGNLSGRVQILDYWPEGATELVSFHPGGEQIVGLGMLDDALAVLFDPEGGMFIKRELHLYDLTDISSPLLLDTYSNDDFPNMLASGTTIAVWDSSVLAEGIQILDASDPTNLTEAAHIATPPLARVTRNGEILGIVASPTMQFVDISSPYFAQYGSIQTIPEAFYLAFHGGTGYLVNSDLAFDLNDPLSPVLVGSTTTARFQAATAVAVSEDYLVVGSGPQLVRMPKQGSAPAPVDDGAILKPGSLSLQAVPNPFNPQVSLEFAMAQDGQAEVDVFDLRGRRIARLGGFFEGPGQAMVVWDGRDSGGQEMPSGVYLVQVITAEGSASLKVVLAR